METTTTDALRQVHEAMLEYDMGITMRDIAEVFDSERAHHVVRAKIEQCALKLDYTMEEFIELISGDLLELLADHYRGFQIHDDLRLTPYGELRENSFSHLIFERTYLVAPDTSLKRVQLALIGYIPYMINRVLYQAHRNR